MYQWQWQGRSRREDGYISDSMFIFAKKFNNLGFLAVIVSFFSINNQSYKLNYKSFMISNLQVWWLDASFDYIGWPDEHQVSNTTTSPPRQPPCHCLWSLRLKSKTRMNVARTFESSKRSTRARVDAYIIALYSKTSRRVEHMLILIEWAETFGMRPHKIIDPGTNFFCNINDVFTILDKI